jgi:hypothetical protein
MFMLFHLKNLLAKLIITCTLKDKLTTWLCLVEGYLASLHDLVSFKTEHTLCSRVRFITKENTIDRHSLKVIQLLPFLQNKTLATKDMEVTHLGCVTVHQLIAGFLLMHSKVDPVRHIPCSVHRLIPESSRRTPHACYGVLEEEVYVRQPLGFESEKYPHQVYKLRKALDGLKQAPRAWYGRLRGFLFWRGFEMGKVDQTLFLLRQGRDILIVQVYVDDIVFGGSSNSLVARFAEDMCREFEMSMMGELQFFLGLQIKQSKEGTFVHQAKYTKDIVRKFKMKDSKAMTTPVSTITTFDADEEGDVVWTSLGPLHQWVPGPTTRWAPGTTRLALHGT